MHSRLCLVPQALMRTTVLFLTPPVCPQLLWDTRGLMNREAAGDVRPAAHLGPCQPALHVHGS